MKSDRAHWEALAEREPYFAVLSDRRFLTERINAETLREFFESGEAQVESLLRLGREELHDAGVARRVLEYGCGPGRLAIAFALHGLEVTAVDISAKMLAIARKNAEATKVGNIEYVLAEDFFRGAAEFDLISLHLVLQHLRPQAGLDLLRRLLPRLSHRGTIHIHVPYKSTLPVGARLLRGLRSQVPGANSVANLLRGRSTDIPFLPPHVYDMSDVLSVLHAGGIEPKVTRLSAENELEVAVISGVRLDKRSSVHCPTTQRPPDRAVAVRSSTPVGMIDVQQMIRETSIEELNRRAEQYFAGMTTWDVQLAKPFSSATDAPAMLTNLAVLIDGMHLVRGHRVVDFGAGTGWLGRALTQLGAQAYLVDVSQSALRIANELFERLPVVGDHVEPVFVHYDGRKIDLPDESVDRIICFDSFHHVPNPDDVLREFARILAPGGIAAFGEPGPEHSRTPQSQFEMRAYGVVENDIDIHRIWALAREIGFSDMRVAAFSGSALLLGPDEFEDLLVRGPVLQQFGESARAFLENARTFFLYKTGAATLDSRTAGALACSIQVEIEEPTIAGQPVRARATVMNNGRGVWLPSDSGPGAVSLGCHLYKDGQLANLDYHWEAIPGEGLQPGQSATFTFALPPLAPGDYELEFDCVARDVAWFGQVGAGTTSRVAVRAVAV